MASNIIPILSAEERITFAGGNSTYRIHHTGTRQYSVIDASNSALVSIKPSLQAAVRYCEEQS